MHLIPNFPFSNYRLESPNVNEGPIGHAYWKKTLDILCNVIRWINTENKNITYLGLACL